MSHQLPEETMPNVMLPSSNMAPTSLIPFGEVPANMNMNPSLD